MKACNTNPFVKYLRIVLSLVVIGLGIYYRNWVGVLGIFTMISAFTGECGLSVRINRRSHGPSGTEKY